MMMKGNGRNCLLVEDLIVLFIIFSDGAGGCFGKSKREAEWLYCLIVAEAEAFKQSECTTQQVALKRE
jgi:hypothetical protein